MDGTLILGAIGLVTTALAGPLNNKQATRSEHKKWFRDQRNEALTDAVAYAQHLFSRIEYVDQPYIRRTTGSVELVHPDLIAARLWLTTNPELMDAWTSMRQAEDWLFEDLRNNYPAPNMQLPDGYEILRQTRDCTKQLLALSRSEFSS